MLKLGVIATNLAFLDWTRHFETRIEGSIKGSGLRFILAKKSLSRTIRAHTKWADVVLVDFLTELGVLTSKVSTKPIHIRIHRYELDYPEIFNRVEWNNVASVVAVSEYYATLLRELVPKEVPVNVAPPGVVERKWPYHPSDTNKLCTWSIPTHRKRIYDLMLALRDYTLYLGGYSANDRILQDINQRYSLGHILEPDVEFPQWQWDKEFYFHNALDESFGVAIAEAMLSGLIPIIHRTPTALELVSEELTFVYNEELIDLLERMLNMDRDERNIMKEAHRQRIIDKFTSDITAEKLEAIFMDHINK
jgi:hypothetical protein